VDQFEVFHVDIDAYSETGDVGSPIETDLTLYQAIRLAESTHTEYNYHVEFLDWPDDDLLSDE